MFDLFLAAAGEIAAAMAGGDWGYGALAEFVGADAARFIVNAAAAVMGY